MRVKTLQVVWHSQKPIYSVDFHPSGLLATGGGDKDVKLWKVVLDADRTPAVEHVGHLAGHTRDVNSVRFSPTGQMLVSAGVGGEMYLWKPSNGPQKVFGSDDTDPGWRSSASLRGHTDDVQDVAWAPDASALVSGSIENICIVWDTEGGTRKCRWEEHRHYVQGVAWDPASEFVVSQSADRTCRVYGHKAQASTKKKGKQGVASNCAGTAQALQCLHVLNKKTLPSSDAGDGSGQAEAKLQKQSLFQDEQLNSFFRRLAWSPDGSFLVVPCGQYKQTADSPTLCTAYVYARGHWSQPALRLPSTHQPVVAIRFCPQLLTLRETFQSQSSSQSETASSNGFQLPYRMVFAVATLDSIIIHDTQSATPLAVLGALHFEAITDLAWSCDGSLLVIASYDGYCSVAVFDNGELGIPVPEADLPPHIKSRMACAAKQVPGQTQHPSAKSTCLTAPQAPVLQLTPQQDPTCDQSLDDCSASPLPVRQLGISKLQSAGAAGSKRIAPTEIASGLQEEKKARRIAP